MSGCYQRGKPREEDKGRRLGNIGRGYATWGLMFSFSEIGLGRFLSVVLRRKLGAGQLWHGKFGMPGTTEFLLMARLIMGSDDGRKKENNEFAKWKRPDAGFVKINCDASATDADCGIDIIARDQVGQVIFAGAQRIQQGSTTEVAEVEAILWAMEVAIETGLSRVIIESNCAAVVTKIQKRELPCTLIGILVAKIIARGWEFSSCDWSFVRRNANNATHWLAAWSPDSRFPCFKSELLPSVLLRLVNNDALL